MTDLLLSGRSKVRILLGALAFAILASRKASSCPPRARWLRRLAGLGLGEFSTRSLAHYISQGALTCACRVQVDERGAFAVVSHPDHEFLGVRACVGGQLVTRAAGHEGERPPGQQRQAQAARRGGGNSSARVASRSSWRRRAMQAREAISGAYARRERSAHVEDLSAKRYTHARDRWVVRPSTAEEAGLLELAPGTTVAHLVHTAYSEDGDILEVSESAWPADRVIILDDYQVVQEPEDLHGLSDI